MGNVDREEVLVEEASRRCADREAEAVEEGVARTSQGEGAAAAAAAGVVAAADDMEDGSFGEDNLGPTSIVQAVKNEDAAANAKQSPLECS